MKRLSDTAIAIINDLHAERLDYQSEYLPLIDAANRLAAYEDTGLEPEEVLGKEYAGEVAMSLILSAEYRAIGSVDHLRELVQAEKDGRLVVLPCSIDNPVYVIAKCEDVFIYQDRDTGATECPFEDSCSFDDCRNDQEQIFKTAVTGFIKNVAQDDELHLFLEDIELDFTENDIGKTVFLTREGAEAAMEAQKGGGQK